MLLTRKLSMFLSRLKDMKGGGWGKRKYLVGLKVVL